MNVPHCTHDFVRAERLLDGRWAQIFFVVLVTGETNSLVQSVQDALHRLPSPDDVYIVVPGLEATRRVREAMLNGSTPSLAQRFQRSNFRFFAAALDLCLSEVEASEATGASCPLSEADWLPFLKTAMWSQCCPIELAPDGVYFAKSGGRPSLVFVRASRLTQYEAGQFLIALVCLAQFKREAVRLEVTAIHIDTTAISDVGHALAALQTSFAREQSADVRRTRATVRAFQSYGGLATLVVNAFDHEVVLISASTSGGLVHRLVSEKGIPRRNIVTLVADSNAAAGGFAVFDAGSDEGYLSAMHANKECAFDSLTPIHVDDSEFNFAPGKPLSVLLTAADHGVAKWASREKDVLIKEQLANIHGGRLRLLKVSPDKSKLSRRVFALDLAAMLAGPIGTFLLDSLRNDARLHQKNLIVVVESEPDDLTLLIQHVSSLSAAQLSVVSLQDLAAQGELPGVNHVMVCAAIVGSGYVLEDASRLIREKCPDATRAFYVGMWLPGTLSRAETLRRTITFSSTPFRVNALARVAVGNSLAGLTTGDAWHAERALLGKVPERAAHYFAERVEALANPTGDSVVWHPDQKQPLRLGPTFAFWQSEQSAVWTEGRQVYVLLTMAGVLQNARELPLQAGGSLRQSAYQHRVLAAENFFRFNEPLVQGCLLRCAEPFEIDYSTLPDESGAIRAYIVSMVEAPASKRSEALFEFVLSMALRRLKLSKSDEEIVRERCATVPWCQELLMAAVNR